MRTHQINRQIALELKAISDIIDDNPNIYEQVLQDLNRGKLIAYRKGQVA